MNTAATLWGSAAIGAYAGSGLSVDAAELAGVILAINLLLRPLILNTLNDLAETRFRVLQLPTGLWRERGFMPGFGHRHISI